jgi:hypothetical protein
LRGKNYLNARGEEFPRNFSLLKAKECGANCAGRQIGARAIKAFDDKGDVDDSFSQG